MPKKPLLIQMCWLAAVFAAFALGSLRRGASPEPAPSAPTTKNPRATAGSGPAGPEGASSRTGSRTASASEQKLLATTLNISSLDGLGWEDLALRATTDPNPIARRLAFARLLESLTPENALDIRKQLVASNLDETQWSDFNFSWGALAGREVFDFASESEERDLEDALRGWASANPTEALAMIKNLPEERKDEYNRLAASVVAGLATRDPGQASDLVLRLAGEGNEDAPRLMELVAREVLRTGGPEGAAAWSESLPDGPLKAAAMSRVADSFVQRDPVSATRWVEGFADQEYAIRAVEQVGTGLARRDPAAAADWLQDLPEGRGQTAGLNSVFGDWEDRDPIAAGEYLLNMPQSAQRDSAISGFSQGYAWQDPKVAIAWAQDISDPRLRQQTLTRAGQAYFHRDPESARAWLQTSGLSPRAQEAVLNPRER